MRRKSSKEIYNSIKVIEKVLISRQAQNVLKLELVFILKLSRWNIILKASFHLSCKNTTSYFQRKVDQFHQSDRLVAAHHNILTYISEFPSRYVGDIKEESSLGIRGTHSIYKFLYTFLLNIYGEMFVLIPGIVFLFVVHSRDQIYLNVWNITTNSYRYTTDACRLCFI